MVLNYKHKCSLELAIKIAIWNIQNKNAKEILLYMNIDNSNMHKAIPSIIVNKICNIKYRNLNVDFLGRRKDIMDTENFYLAQKQNHTIYILFKWTQIPVLNPGELYFDTNRNNWNYQKIIGVYVGILPIQEAEGYINSKKTKAINLNLF